MFGLLHMLLQLREVSATPDDTAAWAAIPIDIAIPSILLSLLTSLCFVIAVVRAKANRMSRTATLLALAVAGCWLAQDFFQPVHANAWLVARVLATVGICALLIASLRRQSSSG
jgi:hypothetical protein